MSEYDNPGPQLDAYPCRPFRATGWARGIPGFRLSHHVDGQIVLSYMKSTSLWLAEALRFEIVG